ncbi:class E sortase [Nocardioides sp.]|uniref:class E sortase n=1 Tax=Nocardioides sp. TaxID=35761 RepID=UPI002737347D|nr:class E sortase [Nocardioides sp.]MDP3889986.1 class E sortase [Nocardioides sp.]
MSQEQVLSEEGAAAPGGRRWTRRVGVVLVLTGSILLGWVAWQFWGTNWASERQHREIVTALERQWAGAEGPEPFGDADAIVRIPRFGDDYAVPVLAGTNDEVLAAGYGHFDGAADPGELGNYALAGHRVTNGEPLRRMPELVAGDEVIVETATATHVYVLDTGGEDLTVSFTDTWVVDPLPTNPRRGGVQPPSQEEGQRLITLTTCSEIFRTDNRLIAFGHLLETIEK